MLIQSLGHFAMVLNKYKFQGDVSLFLIKFNFIVLVVQERLQHNLKMRNVNTWHVWNSMRCVYSLLLLFKDNAS